MVPLHLSVVDSSREMGAYNSGNLPGWILRVVKLLACHPLSQFAGVPDLYVAMISFSCCLSLHPAT